MSRRNLVYNKQKTRTRVNNFPNFTHRVVTVGYYRKIQVIISEAKPRLNTWLNSETGDIARNMAKYEFNVHIFLHFADSSINIIFQIVTSWSSMHFQDFKHTSNRQRHLWLKVNNLCTQAFCRDVFRFDWWICVQSDIPCVFRCGYCQYVFASKQNDANIIRWIFVSNCFEREFTSLCSAHGDFWARTFH